MFTALGRFSELVFSCLMDMSGLQNHASCRDVDQFQAAPEVGHVVHLAFFVYDFDEIAIASPHAFAHLFDVSRAGRVYGARFAVVVIFDCEFHCRVMLCLRCGLSVHRFGSVALN